MSTPAKKLSMVPGKVRMADLAGGAEPRPLDVGFENGFVLHLKYRRDKLTAAVQYKDSRQAAAIVANLVTEWNATDDDGDIPVGPEHVEDVTMRANLMVLGQILYAIVLDCQPDPTSVRSLSATSRGNT